MMDSAQSEIIKDLRHKTTLVKDLYEKVALEKRMLLQEKIELTQKIEEQSNIIADLERKYKSLQLAKAVSTSDSNNSAAGDKIDGLVKEIDKCIALLNK